VSDARDAPSVQHSSPAPAGGRCPTCRAAFRGKSVCPRCGTDLSGPMRVRIAAWRLRREARAAFLAGRPGEALDRATGARHLHATPACRRLVEVLRVLDAALAAPLARLAPEDAPHATGVVVPPPRADSVAGADPEAVTATPVAGRTPSRASDGRTREVPGTLASSRPSTGSRRRRRADPARGRSRTTSWWSRVAAWFRIAFRSGRRGR